MIDRHAGVEGRPERRGVAHVGFGRHDPAAERLDSADGLVEFGPAGHRIADRRIVLKDVYGNDVGALLGQADRMAAPLTPPRAGDESNLAFDPS